MAGQVLVERVEPVDGFYVAAYACAPGESGAGSVGYFKLFGSAVASYFDPADCLLKGAAGRTAPTASAAVNLAIRAARSHLNDVMAGCPWMTAADEWAVVDFGRP